MKFKIVLYLFLFVSVVLIFQLVNTNKILNHQDQIIQKQNRYELQLKDSLMGMNELLETKDFFTYKSTPQVEAALRAQLLTYNTQKRLNQLIKKLPPNERFLIRSIQLINDQWVMISFQSDKQWGQSLLRYEKKNNVFELSSIKTVIYPLLSRAESMGMTGS
ncbi:MAG: hypothetical protein EBY37_02000 [Flavobacteriia bacterium]|nr:hypothetical protein [Flavobacteriia bacterium]